MKKFNRIISMFLSVILSIWSFGFVSTLAAVTPSEWTRVDDKDARVTYTGSWGDWSGHGTGSYMDTETYSDQKDATASFTFTGNKVRFITTKDGNQGIAEITIDGGQPVEADCFRVPGELQSIAYESKLLETGDHTITVKVAGKISEQAGGYRTSISIDAFEYTTEDISMNNYPNAETLWTKLDNNDPSVSYTEGWTESNVAESYKGTVHRSAAEGAKATFKFNGTKARFYGAKKDEVGIAKVYIDGVFQTQIDTKDGAMNNYDYLLYETRILPEGEHTLTIESTNVTTGGGAGGTEIIIDAFAYTNFTYTDKITYQVGKADSGFTVVPGKGAAVSGNAVRFDKTQASGGRECVLSGPNSQNIPSGKYTLSIVATLEGKTGGDGAILGLDIEGTSILNKNVTEADFAEVGTEQTLSYPIEIPMNTKFNLRFWWDKWNTMTISQVILKPAEPELNKEIVIDSTADGRMFEGIGALSASSTNLLYDYAEPYRSDILDYLFKPKFGASYQHLKVEIGGDGNSTNQTEPAYARTLEEFQLVQKVRSNPNIDKNSTDYLKVKEFFNRGVEFWMMSEAKKRNPDIILDILQWSAPGWFRYKGEYGKQADINTQYELWKKQKFYTQDNADYIATYIWGAKEFHGLDINYCGIWNEHYNPDRNDWIITLRETLDRYGLDDVKIVAAEANHWPTIWESATQLTATEELRNAVDAIGVHYPNWGTPNPYHDNTEAQNCGKPLWASEDGVWGGSWDATLKEARMFNTHYIENRMVKTIFWSTISSSYDGVAITNSGAMSANTPWSGFYDVENGVWGFAHTTQFTKPGWYYINNACGYLDAGGSYVTMQDRSTKDYTVVLETGGASEAQKVKLKTVGMSNAPVHVWRTNKNEQFIEIDTITPVNGEITLTVDKNSIYTLSTTTGQSKGQAKNEVPAKSEFPMSYEDNFNAYNSGERPKYFSDQMGGFEIFESGNGNKTLRQSVPTKPVCWWNDYEPFSFVGNRGLSNFTVSADAMIENDGYAAIYGRVTGPKYGQTHPFGYGMRIDQNGNWQLTVYKDRGNEQYGTYFEVLESGVIKGMSAGKWVNMKIKFMGSEISGYIDNKKIFEYFDEQNSYPAGRAGVGSNYSYVQFDNFKITNLDTDASFVKIDDSEEGAPITYTDGWAKWAGQGYKETVHYVEQPGQEATFKFNGVRARYYGFKRYDLGLIDILVDGVKKETIDLYSEGESMDVMLYETEVLPMGEHTLTIRTTNQKNAASLGTEVIIDAFSFSTEPPKVIVPEQVLLNESSLVMKVGENFRLLAAVLPDNATNGKVLWSSVNSGIATVATDGTITAIKEGKTNIVATTEDGKKTATCEVTVVGPVDKTALNALLIECESLKEADYTAESWKTFKSAYDAAKAIAGNAEATQEQVDSAVTNLREAKNALDVSREPNPGTSDVYIATYLIMAGASAFGGLKLRKKGKMKI